MANSPRTRQSAQSNQQTGCLEKPDDDKSVAFVRHDDVANSLWLTDRSIDFPTTAESVPFASVLRARLEAIPATTHHPQGNEPLTAGSAEYNARYQAARQFSARRIGDLLDDWHSACRSCCPVPKCPPCGLGRIYRLFAQGVPAYCPNE
jgi:hypothetical protein